MRVTWSTLDLAKRPPPRAHAAMRDIPPRAESAVGSHPRRHRERRTRCTSAPRKAFDARAQLPSEATGRPEKGPETLPATIDGIDP